ncbi:cyclase family protein [Hyphomonas oceanitis]|uniref:Cyclase family protein n=1 Tax=Hyphomonas oceanitis SCH89 TaxID=1280953 RepID=A0A059G4U6_9PROT|nr:cyclase family protein [Hyphomonas oceanitis]KDA01857.1 cyclase family protein [Hyphomonas oceanitis SCH89]
MKRRFVDLSMTISSDPRTDPPGMHPEIEYTRHSESASSIASYFPGLTKADLPDGEGWATERIRLSTHNGTHMDAPYHFHSTTDYGKTRAPTIDEVPLDICFSAGVKVDLRHLPDGHVATADDLKEALDKIEYALTPGDIFLANTRAGDVFPEEGFIHAGCGFGREATLFLTEQGVKVVGTDAWSWDAPFSHTARKWAETRDSSIIWEGHKAGREQPYWQMEKLVNLSSLPPSGFEVICFPVKIKAASAGWSRVVAMFTEAGQ